MVIIPAAILCLIPMKNQLIFPAKKMIVITSLVLTSVILAGALIASMIDQAQIHRNWKISLPENLQISDPELCSLLGNLLENVLHGCQTLSPDNRYHNFTICLEHDRFLYLVSSNNFNGIVKQKNHLYLSTHKNGSGIGLSSIATIAEKYHGIAQFSNIDKEFLINVVMDK